MCGRLRVAGRRSRLRAANAHPVAGVAVAPGRAAVGGRGVGGWRAELATLAAGGVLVGTVSESDLPPGEMCSLSVLTGSFLICIGGFEQG